MEIPLSGMALNSGHSRHRPTGALNANSGLMHRNKIRPNRHLVAAAEHRMRYLRIDRDCGRPADVWSNADSWVAKPSQAVQYRRD
jgi:hypothetical protein